MLERQHRGGRQHGDLLGVGDGLERGAHRHFRLAVAHVAAKQAVHGQRRFHVALHVFDGALLVGRFFKLERVLEFALANSCPAETRGPSPFFARHTVPEVVPPCR